MKTSKLLRSSLVILGLAIVAALGTRSAFAGVVEYDLVLTELSDTELMLTYNGPGENSAFNVINNDPDFWTVQIVSKNITLDAFTSDWEEPEDPTGMLVNEVVHEEPVDHVVPDSFNVYSDLELRLLGPVGGTLANGTRVPIGYDTEVPIFLSFYDSAAPDETNVNGVPDSGSTLGLLALSAATLLGLSRFRSGRLT